MDLQERYDELDNIERTLRSLIDDIEDEYYIERLQEIMYEAQNKKEEVEEKLLAENKEEKKAMNKEYWDSQF